MNGGPNMEYGIAQAKGPREGAPMLRDAADEKTTRAGA